MMGFRVVCFVIAVVLFANGAGWLTAIPAVGAIIIPYFAVVFANGGREPTSQRGFRAYEPQAARAALRSATELLPGRRRGAGCGYTSGWLESDMTGTNGVPSLIAQNAACCAPGNG